MTQGVLHRSGPTGRRRSGTLARARVGLARRVAAERQLLLALGVPVLVLGVLLWAYPADLPMALLLLPLILGHALLPPRVLPGYVVGVMAVFTVIVIRQPEYTTRITITISVQYLIGLILLVLSFRRSSLGVAGVRGESMLVDLRDRIMRQSQLPDVPASWLVDYELRTAGGTPFAGDFAVGSRVGDRLQLAVVDVSGKGYDAGSRALLLCGAMGGLIAALPPSQFLASANDYLCRQDWEEGFATAVHLSLELSTGRFELRSAGHPPAVRLSAGSGRWQAEETSGTALGLIEGSTYEPLPGVLRPGDVMLLYTDGLVERNTRDIGLGIDRMLGQAERLLRGDLENGARRLLASVGSPGDDSALLLVHRR